MPKVRYIVIADIVDGLLEGPSLLEQTISFLVETEGGFVSKAGWEGVRLARSDFGRTGHGSTELLPIDLSELLQCKSYRPYKLAWTEEVE